MFNHASDILKEYFKKVYEKAGMEWTAEDDQAMDQFVKLVRDETIDESNEKLARDSSLRRYKL